MGAYEHFGSATDVVDYETKISAFHLTGEFAPDDRWTIGLEGSLTLSEASFDAPVMELPDEVIDIGDYDFMEIPTYSDLEYREISISSRVTRRVSHNASGFVSVGWFDLEDDAPYAYGDVSGSVLVTSAGLETRF